MPGSSYLRQRTLLETVALNSSELLMLRARLSRARVLSIRTAVRSRSVSQIRDMVRNAWELRDLLDDVNGELAVCLAIWPG